MNDSQLHRIDEDRYSRLQLIGWWDQQRLSAARVMVVGAGALGNEVLKNLALVGIGHIVIIDLDSVENSNLSRSVLFRERDAGNPKAEVAAAALYDLNPDLQVQAVHGNVLTDIGLGLVRQMDLVIGCLDNREARLWVNRMCWKVNRPWIDGGIQEINGVARVFQPPDGACYECGMTETDYRLIQLRYSCPLLRREDLLEGKVPTAPTIASIIAGLQVQEGLKLLHGLPVEDATSLVFNGSANQFYKSAYQHSPECLSHETWSPIVESELTHAATASDLFNWVRNRDLLKPTRLVLDRDLVTELRCARCDQTTPIMRVRAKVPGTEGVCPACDEIMAPGMIHAVDAGSEMAQRQLSELGIPDHDIVKVEDEAGGAAFISLRAINEGANAS